MKVYFVFLSISVLPLVIFGKSGFEDDDLQGALDMGLSGGLQDLMESFGHAIDGLADMAEGKSIECNYKCESGKKPSPKPGHKPTSNGCGSFGIEFDTAKLPMMTSCCDLHDYCYDTCNTNKETCDKDLRECLLKMCTTMKNTLDQEEFEGCEATAELMYRGTLALGCTPFKKAQKKACVCQDEIDSKSDGKKNKTVKKTSTDSKSTTAKSPKTDTVTPGKDDSKSKKNKNKEKKAKTETVPSDYMENEEMEINRKKDSKSKASTSRESGEL